ncbi:MAG: hypothetical protein A2583_02900 [Bdellovibrionales bacterium RIFOXYD1_FULL_53_11]|nr:MAG: hypothetical protein A2583_02900 [Bdellovibrionales bacterium RIFOXYD1_FULL_53_11]
MKLTACQKSALKALKSGSGNVFLTGVAGSGKSTVVARLLEKKDHPIVASTGTAALMLGGRTFHSFFGVGIMEGGFEETVKRALRNPHLARRLKKADTVVIDEISMISGEFLRAAETITRLARASGEPWGGMRIIAVGDFAQLPPVSRTPGRRDWAFLSETWKKSGFENLLLETVVRSSDQRLLGVLNDVRVGELTYRVRDFLDSRIIDEEDDAINATILFPFRSNVEDYNLGRLRELDDKEHVFDTVYEIRAAKKDPKMRDKIMENLKRQAPVPGRIVLKRGALVMMRKNDLEGEYANGSLGHVRHIEDEALEISLLAGGSVLVEKADFTYLDADGTPVAAARNFPVTLAYATTIHKSQGMTLDKAVIDLSGLWEPGQAYVGLSRVRSSDGLYITKWQPGSIRVDAAVAGFYEELAEKTTRTSPRTTCKDADFLEEH